LDINTVKLTEHDVQRAAARVVMAQKVKGPGTLKAYGGNAYFVSAWEGPDTTFEQAVAEVQNPLTLTLILNILGLEYILADRHATAGLRKCLIEGNRLIRQALVEYADFQKPKGKPGPRPKAGGYIRDAILKLDREGLSDTKIARVVYPNDDSRKARSLVAAHLSQARKRNPPLKSR
jgi:hypothetical protein